MRQLFKTSKSKKTDLPVPPPHRLKESHATYPNHDSSASQYSTLEITASSDEQPGRRPSERSDLSDIQAQLFPTERSLSHQQKRSQDRKDNPLGLTVLYEPTIASTRTVDILFVHGLGGTSLQTWCQNRNLETLWPKLWLPREAGFETARIITYGYNAHFSSHQKEQASLAIGDFANDLLFRMKYGQIGEQRLGDVPIVFVVHSMGGLVFKKAFVSGLLNSDFHDMMSMIRSVLFLATPHRGTDLAKTLNKVLMSSIFGHAPKDYISELARRSPTTDELNESFRHHASKLRVFSFYETLSTSIGPVATMILPKDTAVLGYPGETHQALIANHHDVCKFKGNDDPNYVAVVGALRSAMVVAVSQKPNVGFEDNLKLIKDSLGVNGPPEDDIAVARSARKEGTCEYFLETSEVLGWRRSDTSSILWVHAHPGNGKSTLCAFTVDRLIEHGHICAYFFFKVGHLEKKSVGAMLRSIALQMALAIPSASRELADTCRSGLNFQKADAFTIWKRLFLSSLAHVRSEKQIFWIIDGLDESESSRKVVEILSEIGTFAENISILISSRPQPAISQAMQKARKKIGVTDMSISNNQNDIRLAVLEDIEYLPSDDDFKQETIAEITKRSQGNFLWASLVANQVAQCHRQDQVKRILEATPDGMDSLYDRMLEAISGLDNKEDLRLARMLLSWAMYAKTPLTVEELSESNKRELDSLIDLKHTVHHVCGQFVIIDTHNKLSLVHHSAREYLRRHPHLPFSLESKDTHEDLLGKCLVTLCNKDLRSRIATLRIPQFLQYAATSWSFHLENCSVQSDRVLNGLMHLFNNNFVLSWIQYMAMIKHLSDLPGVSRRLTAYIARRRKLDDTRSPMLHRLTDLATLESWAVDLLKVTAKFGQKLSEDPTLIFKCIPRLSPTSSAIFQKFGPSSSTNLSITGVTNDEWDDCLVRVSSNGGKALRLACCPRFLAVAAESPKGSITLWNTSLFQEHTVLSNKQRILDIVFDRTGSLLACCGVNRTRVWNLDDNSVLLDAKNPFQERAVGLKFDNEGILYMATDIRRVYKLATHSNEPTGPASSWVQLSPDLLTEKQNAPGMWLGTPQTVAFNSDCTAIAIAYRSFGPTIWRTTPPRIVARLNSATNHENGATYRYSGGETKLVWHPSDNQVLGIQGEVFKWTPSEDVYERVNGQPGTTPNDIQCSPNGVFFITGDIDGAIKIYEVSSMSLIYTLSSEDGISRICFSSDSLRFYDLRGAYCNIWEPNSLARLADASLEKFNDDASTSDSFWSDTDETGNTSISVPVSENYASSKPRVMALAVRSHDGVIAFSNSDGSMEIYNPSTDRRHALEKSALGIYECLTWSGEHDLLARSESYGGVTVLRITESSDRDLTSDEMYYESASHNSYGSVRQLLFAGSGDLLLLHGDKKTQVISISKRTVIVERDTPSGGAVRWIRHPFSPNHILCLNIDGAIVYDWGLDEQYSAALSIPDSLQIRRTTLIDSILESHYSGRLLVRTVSSENNRRLYGYMILSVEELEEVNAKHLDQAKEMKIVQQLQSVLDPADQPIGLLPNGHMVFLDESMWVCTAQLHDSKSIKRHFFVPRDWITSDGILLCHLDRDGRFYLPMKGRVALIDGNLI